MGAPNRVIMFGEDGDEDKGEMDYRSWKIWAEAHLERMELRGVPREALGLELFAMIMPGSTGFKAVKEI